MHFARFWAYAREGDFACWRWSDRSESDARDAAERAAHDLKARFVAGNFPDRASSYGYPTGPLREEIVEELALEDGRPTALISRNSLGCLVLNTKSVLFVDIDFEEEKKAPSLFSRLFSKPASNTPARDAAVARVSAELERRSSLGSRLYETKAGLRLLVTERTFEPKSSEVRSLFETLGADPLYARLCDTQESFRARLTPKPYRCGCASPIVRWPFRDESQRGEFQQWEKEYRGTSEAFATCRFLRSFGTPRVAPEIQPVLSIHDEMTKSSSTLPLA